MSKFMLYISHPLCKMFIYYKSIALIDNAVLRMVFDSYHTIVQHSLGQSLMQRNPSYYDQTIKFIATRIHINLF